MQPIRRAGGALDFDLTEEQQLFADTSRRFLADECDLSTIRKLAETDAGFIFLAKARQTLLVARGSASRAASPASGQPRRTPGCQYVRPAR